MWMAGGRRGCGLCGFQLERFQGGKQLGRALVALVAVFFDALVHDGLERIGYVGGQCGDGRIDVVIFNISFGEGRLAGPGSGMRCCQE